MHPDNGKSKRDIQYDYAASVFHLDHTSYQNYINDGSFQLDIQKINNLKTNVI